LAPEFDRTGAARVASIAHAGDSGAPATARRPVMDTYHGKQVSDSYRWLEDPNSTQEALYPSASIKPPTCTASCSISSA